VTLTNAVTGTGKMVLDTSPTLVTPALGTPASGVLTNCTGVQYNGYKNRIINGAMVIDQRYAGAATANTINGYNIDRFQIVQTVTGKLIAQQNAGSVTPPAGFVKYQGITSQSAYSVLAGDYYLIQHPIEGLNVTDLAWGTASAATVTLSFWVRSSLTGTFGGSLRNNASSRCYPFSYTISSANTWEQKSITIAGDTTGTWLTDTGLGIWVLLGLGVGSTNGSGTAGAWVGSQVFVPSGSTSVVGTNGATFYITGVQLEKGSTATNFDYRPYGTEFALCQRYFVGITNAGFAGVGFNESTTKTNTQINLPVLMRSAPTLTAPTTYQVNYAAASTPGTAITSSIGAAGGLLNVTTAAVLTTGHCAAFTVLTGILGLSSEF